jgi:transposase
MDEAGIEEYIYRTHGKSQKGERIYGEVSGKRYVRTSVISALNSQNKLIAPFLFKGMTDTSLVIWWVENILLPALPKNSTIIWDNAAFHKSEMLRELVEDQHKHTMVFLPPYSPDLNPIEHKWHELKQRLRKYYDESVDFMDNLIREVKYMSKFSVG